MVNHSPAVTSPIFLALKQKHADFVFSESESASTSTLTLPSELTHNHCKFLTPLFNVSTALVSAYPDEKDTSTWRAVVSNVLIQAKCHKGGINLEVSYSKKLPPT